MPEDDLDWDSMTRVTFRLEEARWQAFLIALDRPAKRLPRLAKLLAEKSALE